MDTEMFSPRQLARRQDDLSSGIPGHRGGTRGMPVLRAEAGFSLIELLIVVAIIGLLTSIAVPVFANALSDSRRAALVADANELYSAFIRYNVDHALFPSTASPVDRALNLWTLAPLSTGGYFSSAATLTGKLLDSKITAYDSPNVGAADTEFWAVLTLGVDPETVLLVARTSDYPGFEGTWLDGSYWVVGSELIPISEES
jgi:prepilin-type N-terminal cleavage/methylation domain-containing protein